MTFLPVVLWVLLYDSVTQAAIMVIIVLGTRGLNDIGFEVNFFMDVIPKVSLLFEETYIFAELIDQEVGGLRTL